VGFMRCCCARGVWGVLRTYRLVVFSCRRFSSRSFRKMFFRISFVSAWNVSSNEMSFRLEMSFPECLSFLMSCDFNVL